MMKQSQNHRCHAEFISASHMWQSQLEIPNWNIKKDIE
jgi:hypothetical protein